MGNKKTKKALHQDIIMDGEWVLDYVLTLLQSPSWEVPIMIFVDENCIVFDTEDENKFVYTDSEFKELGNKKDRDNYSLIFMTLYLVEAISNLYSTALSIRQKVIVWNKHFSFFFSQLQLALQLHIYN